MKKNLLDQATKNSPEEYYGIVWDIHGEYLSESDLWEQVDILRITNAKYDADLDAIKTNNINLADFQHSTEKDVYYLVIAILVFSYIEDIESAFSRVYKLLEVGGEFHLVIPDYKYLKQKRYDPSTEFEELSQEEFVIQTKIEGKMTTLIVRKLELYKKIAKRIGLKLIKDDPIHLKEEFPMDSKKKEEVVGHFIRFEKSRLEKLSVQSGEYKLASTLNLKIKDRIEHPSFGKGVIRSIEGNILVIDFKSHGKKKVAREYTKLKRL